MRREVDLSDLVDAHGIAEVVEGRRLSSYFVPIPAARKRGGQQVFDTEWTRAPVVKRLGVERQGVSAARIREVWAAR